MADYTLDRSHQKVLRRNFRRLKKTILPAGIIDHLYAEYVLDDTDYEDITRMDTTTDTVEMLLLYLMRKSNDCYTIFLEVLKNNSHQHVADFLQVIQLMNNI